jgi:hypothetical protein
VTPLALVEAVLDESPSREALLRVAEEILETWIEARGEAPTQEASEGFRLLALHRQGARGVPSFNACRETCREVAYHFNLLALPDAGEGEKERQRRMMTMLVRHLALFVYGKMEVEGLGEFCCSSRPLRLESPAEKSEEPRHA